MTQADLWQNGTMEHNPICQFLSIHREDRRQAETESKPGETESETKNPLIKTDTASTENETTTQKQTEKKQSKNRKKEEKQEKIKEIKKKEKRSRLKKRQKSERTEKEDWNIERETRFDRRTQYFESGILRSAGADQFGRVAYKCGLWFLNILFKILAEEQPQYLAVAFDLKAPTFRHKMYDAYKGTKAAPPQLHEQVPVMKEVLTAMGVPLLMKKGL